MDKFWNKKRVLVYIALAHHTRFLSPVTDILEKKGARIRYIVGQAERSQEITALNLGLDYRHVFDYLDETDQRDVLDNYKTLRHQFALSLNTSFLFSTTPVTVIDKTIHASAMEYVGFRKAIQAEQPDVCFALHELNRWGKMFAFWAKKFNIPFITFQEGLYYGLNFGYTGHVQYSTLNLVWGERIKNKLTNFQAAADKILLVGNTHLAKEARHQKDQNIRDKKRKSHQCQDKTVILLLFSGEIAASKDLLPVFEAVARNDDKRIFVKFHPATKLSHIEGWEASIPPSLKSCVNIVTEEGSTYDLMSMSDICVLVQPSTTGLEALFFNKPLVHLNVPIKTTLPYSFTELKVAADLTPESFAEKLVANEDFSSLVDPEDVQAYLSSELSETRNSVEKTIEISEKLILAKESDHPNPLETGPTPDLDWSIIFPVSDHLRDLLVQLESIAQNSENQGTYEILPIEFQDAPAEIKTLLDSLKGNVARVQCPGNKSRIEMMNKAAEMSRGKRLIFLDAALSPLPGWLAKIEEASKRHGPGHIFGGRITDPFQSILHAGMVVDENNAPVSAYQYLNAGFPQAMKERAFQMLNYFIAIEKTFFFELNGFQKKAGKFKFLDLCLRANKERKDQNGCVYIPPVLLQFPDHFKEAFEPESSIFFFGRWHGELWENRSDLYETDGVSEKDIDSAKLTQASASPGL